MLYLISFSKCWFVFVLLIGYIDVTVSNESKYTTNSPTRGIQPSVNERTIIPNLKASSGQSPTDYATPEAYHNTSPGISTPVDESRNLLGTITSRQEPSDATPKTGIIPPSTEIIPPSTEIIPPSTRWGVVPEHECDEDKICVRKCCPEGTLMDFEKGCSETDFYNTTDWEPNFEAVDKDKIEVVTQTLKTKKDLVCAMYEPNEFLLQDDGNVYHYASGKTLSYHYYCMEKTYERKKLRVGAGLCLPIVVKSEFNKIADIVQMTSLAISSFFMILILLFYVINPAKKELQSKLVIFACISLFFGFVLVIVNMSPLVNVIQNDRCVALAISIQFFFLSFLFWLNLMCYEISRIIRGTLNFESFKDLTRSERRIFFYGAYAWGIPLLVCTITIFMQYLPEVLPSAIEPYIIRPHIAEGICWFKDSGGSIYAYYYGIEVFLYIMNACLMGHTAYLLFKDKWASLCFCRSRSMVQIRVHTSVDHFKMLLCHESKRCSTSHMYVSRFKQQLCTYFISLISFYIFIWFLNTLSLTNPRHEFWRIVDFIVGLQGVFLFCIVVQLKFPRWNTKKLKITPLPDVSTSHNIIPLSPL